MAQRWYVVHAYSGFENQVMKMLKERIARSGLDDQFGDVLVPTEAVFEEAGKSYVWLVDKDNTCHKTVVRIASIEGTSVRIVEGLKAKQRVIAAGVSQITEGLKVREFKKERGL